MKLIPTIKRSTVRKVGKRNIPIGKSWSFYIRVNVIKNLTVNSDYELLEPITKEDIDCLFIEIDKREYVINLTTNRVDLPLKKCYSLVTCELTESCDSLISDYVITYNKVVEKSNSYRQDLITKRNLAFKLNKDIEDNQPKLDIIQQALERVIYKNYSRIEKCEVKVFDKSYFREAQKVWDYIQNDKIVTKTYYIRGEALGRNYNLYRYIVWGNLDTKNFPKGNENNYTIEKSGTDEVLGEYQIVSCCIDSGD